MKKKSFAIVLFVIAMSPLTLAHTGEQVTTTGHQEEAGLSHEFQDILPFHHFAEGHGFASVMLILLWASFFYTLYSIFRILSRGKRKK